MPFAPRIRPFVVLGLASALLLAGCLGGDDDEGDTVAEPTAPTTTAAQPTTPAVPTTPAKKKTKPAKQAPATPAPTGCVKDPRFTGVRFTGIPCDQAYALAAAWDSMGEDCNTIDDPSSPEGFKRTCEVNGYTCNAKRVTTSDARKVACSMGSSSVKFKWEP